MGRRDDTYWAEFLGIEPADWMRSGVTFRSHVGLRGYRGLWCFRRASRVVVSAPPAWVERLEDLWAGWPPERFMDPAAVAASLGEACDRCIGPVFQGCIDPKGFKDVVSSSVRSVQARDRAAIERFRDRCGSQAWDVSGLAQVGSIAHVYPDGEEIEAMAGFRDRGGDVGDLCVLTDPRVRGQGRGAAVVSAVTRDALAQGLLVRYQTLDANEAAVKLALSLGYERYGTHLAVRLKHD